jgi:hypothetical protein
MTNFYKEYREVARFLLLCLLLAAVILMCGDAKGQTFVQSYNLPYVTTSIKFKDGSIYYTTQQGVLGKDSDTIRVFPVMFQQECGLIDFDFVPEGYILHISSTDSTQKILRYDTLFGIVDTLLSVPYKLPFSNRHRGGSVIYQDGIIYCSFGYGANLNHAQDFNTLRGKLVKLDNTGPSILAYGLRNPFRFTIDWPDFWIADVGGQLMEEVNYFNFETDTLVNYGWPCWEGSTEHIDTCGSVSYPVYEYAHNGPASITGGCMYEQYYYWSDYRTGEGGKIDSLGFNYPLEMIPDVTSIAVNPVTNKLNLATWDGDVFEMEELPLSIDTIQPDEIIYPCKNCYNLYFDIYGRRWEYPPIGIPFWAIWNSIQRSKLQYIFIK